MTSYVNITDKPEDKKYLERYVNTSRGIFDNEVYYKRVSVLAESTLLEAESRGANVERMVYLNIIGCGMLFLYYTCLHIFKNYAKKLKLKMKKIIENHFWANP